MPYLTDLATAARKSGLRVVEVEGWRTRGHGPMTGPNGIICHHTATSAKAPGNYPSLRVVRDGRPGLDGPLAQLGLGRDGTVYVIAAGKAWHAGPAFEAWQTNSQAIGIEAEGDGKTPFNDVQMKAYVALCAALCEHYQIPTGHVDSHKQIAKPHYRKVDPYGVDMADFRAKVAQARKVGPASTVDVPPRDPNYGHRGIPADLVEDGVFGAKTVDAWMWYVPGGDRLVGLTRDNVRDIETWLGRERTGLLDTGDIRALQAKTGSTVDGIWPRDRKSNTTLGLQRFLNKRIWEARDRDDTKPPAQDK